MRALQILPIVLIAWLVAVVPVLGDDAEERAQDVAQMKKVWEALMSFQNSRGKLPDRLSDLVPEFLHDPKILVSPRDAGGAGNNGPLTVKDDKHPSSYGYEWGPQPFRGLTFAEVKECQVAEYGPVVPLLRCFLYEPVLNISHAGEFYETGTNWEIDPAVKGIIARRGLGPGATKGKFLELTTADPAGKPLAGVRVTVLNRRIQGIWLPDRSLTTGEDGRAKVPFGPVEIMWATLRFEAPNHFAFLRASDGNGFPDKLEVVLHPKRQISGIVAGADGKPLANAVVRMSRLGPNDRADRPDAWFPVLAPDIFDPDRIGIAKTDPEGRWALESFPDDPALKVKIAIGHQAYRVQIRQADFSTLTKEGYFNGAAKISLPVPLRITGTLSDPEGRSMGGVPVFLFAPVDPTKDTSESVTEEGRTDADGGFDFQARVPGLYTVVGLAKGLTPARETFSMIESVGSRKLTVPPGRVLKGRVIDYRNRPVPNVNILFGGWAEGPGLPTNPVVATTDTDGNWAWQNAPAMPVYGHAIYPSGTLGEWWEENNQPISIQVPQEELE